MSKNKYKKKYFDVWVDLTRILSIEMGELFEIPNIKVYMEFLNDPVKISVPFDKRSELISKEGVDNYKNVILKMTEDVYDQLVNDWKNVEDNGENNT